MEVKDPFELLTSDRPSERLEGARLARKLALAPGLIGELRRLRGQETDTFVIAALDRALAQLEVAGGNSEQGEVWVSKADLAELEDVRADAIQTVTQTVLHEIRPLISEVFRSAREELDSRFATSATNASIDRLKAFLEVVQRLWDASASPRFVEFDVADLISQEITRSESDRALATRLDPVVVSGDPDLLRLAVQNVLRNAIEASDQTADKVIVNCDASDREAWIVVLDRGVGLPEASTRVWEPGVTKKSKDEHFGWGLSITQRAIHSMNGTVRLSPREHGGTACEIRWPLSLAGEETREDSAR